MKINIIKEDCNMYADTKFQKGCPDYSGVKYHGNVAYWGDLTFGHLLCLIDNLDNENMELKDRIHTLEDKLEEFEEKLEELECAVV